MKKGLLDSRAKDYEKRDETKIGITLSKVVRLLFFVLPSIKDDSDDSKEFEDNKPVELQGKHWKHLAGRARSEQELLTRTTDMKWIYQRFVQATMQFFTEPGGAWYKVRVDGNAVAGSSWMHGVVFVFSFLSPFLFPVASVLGCSNLAWLRLKSAEPNFSWTLMSTVFYCSCYCWCAVCPFLYVLFGDVRCDMDTKCRQSGVDHIDYKISGVTFVFPWIACMIAGFRFSFEICDSACDCACDKKQDHLDRVYPEYKDAKNIILQKLSNPKDTSSFYPTFGAEGSQPPDIGTKICLTCVAIVCAITPNFIMKFNHPHEKMALSNEWQRVMTFTGILGVSIQFSLFLYLLVDVLFQFFLTVNEVLIFAYITSSPRMRARDAIVKPFLKTIQYNDTLRKNSKPYKQLKRRNRTYVLRQADERKQQVKKLYQDPTNGSLGLHLIEFNFANKEGVQLWRVMREWLRIDILAERVGAELFMLVCIFFVIAVGGSCFVTVFIFKKATVITIWGPFTCALLLIFLSIALNLCVTANEYLFDWQPLILYDWIDTISFHPHGLEQGRSTDLGLIWYEDARRHVGSDGKLSAQMGAQMDAESVEWQSACKALKHTIKCINLLEEKQEILGLPVTAALRNRVMFTMGSLLLPTIVHAVQASLKAL